MCTYVERMEGKECVNLFFILVRRGENLGKVDTERERENDDNL